MIIIKACILYVVSGFGGYATSACLIDGSVLLSSPDYVYQIDTMPSNIELHVVDSAYVEYWTEPTIRVVFGNYRTYVRSRRASYRPVSRHTRVRVAPRRPAVRPRLRSPSRPRIRHRIARKRILRSQKKVRHQRKRYTRRPSRKVYRRHRRPVSRRHIRHRKGRPARRSSSRRARTRR